VVATPDDKATPGPALAKKVAWAQFGSPLSVRPLEGGAWAVVERGGKVWRYDGTDRKLLIDVSSDVSVEAEQGLFDFVVSPDNKHAYIHYSGKEKPFGDNHILEYRWTGSDVVGKPREVLVVEHPYIHHYAGQLQFGPDGYLYIAIGDGGTPELAQLPDNGDPHNNGQGTDELLGNILRIDPRPDVTRAYTIPDDNPFVGKDGRDEIWARGLRNPWRFSFDKKTGDLWIPDVGHRFWEEVNFQPADSKGGQNYGWSLVEGLQRYKGGPPKDHTPPVYSYPHRNNSCAIIGGYVYRGSAIPEIQGNYIFGDFCSGVLQALTIRDGKVVKRRFLGVTVEGLSAIAEDRDGELFAMSVSKGIYRIAPL
jgi:glucose/arabinose dehydrogenase